MKKLLCLFLLAASLFSFCSCRTVSSFISAMEITFEEKYIHTADIELPAEEQEYYILHKNGYGEHHFYYANALEAVYHYTVTFKYEILDDHLVEGYSVSQIIHEDDNQMSAEEFRKGSKYLFKCYKNTLIEENQYNRTYVREGYAEKEILS